MPLLVVKETEELFYLSCIMVEMPLDCFGIDKSHYFCFVQNHLRAFERAIPIRFVLQRDKGFCYAMVSRLKINHVGLYMV